MSAVVAIMLGKTWLSQTIVPAAVCSGGLHKQIRGSKKDDGVGDEIETKKSASNGIGLSYPSSSSSKRNDPSLHGSSMVPPWFLHVQKKRRCK